MATQSNNFILIERDAASPIRGQQRSIDAADDIVLAPATVSIAPSGNVAINSSSGTLSMGNSASTQAINLGTAGARIITIGQGVGTGPTIVLNGVTNATQIESNGVLAIGSNYVGAETVYIGSGNLGVFAQTRTINIGNTTSNSGVNLYAGFSSNILLSGPIQLSSAASQITIAATSGSVSIDATTFGTINLGTNGGTGAINIGTAATNRQIIIGNATNTSALTLNAGSGGISLTTNATAGSISIGNDNGTGAVTIGNGTASRALLIGAGLGDGSVNLGTGAVVGRSVTVGSSTGTSSLSLQSGTGALNIGTAATNKIITIGQTANTSLVALNGGTGGITLSTGATTGAINIGNDTGTGNISIAGASATAVRYVVIGTGSVGQKTVDIGSNAVAGNSVNLFGGSTGGISIGNEATATGPVNIVGAGATGARSVNVATGGTAAKTLTMGSTASTSSTTIQTGTGAMTFTAGGIYDVNATGAVTIDSSGGAISIGTDNVNQDINLGSAGTRFIGIGSWSSTRYITLRMGSRGALIENGVTYGMRGFSYLCLNRTASTISDGSIVAFQASPAADSHLAQVQLANANGATANLRVPFGAAMNQGGPAWAAAGTGLVQKIGMFPVKFAVAPAGGADIGKPVYLSETDGQATLTAPSAAGRTIYRLGYLARGVADAAGLWYVDWNPQFIADIP